MKGKNYCHFIRIFYIWIYFTITKVLSKIPEINLHNIEKRDTTNINILIDKPDSIVNKIYNITYYNNEINQYLSNYVNDIKVNFSYNDNESTEKKSQNEYEDYVKYIINQLKDSKYDMLILDDNFIFSELSFIESSYVMDTFEERNIHKYYLNLSECFENNEKKMANNVAFKEAYNNIFSYSSDNKTLYSEDIVKGGYYNNILYGLPFEIDSDIGYIRNISTNRKKRDEDKIFINLADDDKLMSLFIYFLVADGYYNEKSMNSNKDGFLLNKLEGNLKDEYLEPFRRYVQRNVDDNLTVAQINNLTLNTTLNNFLDSQSNNDIFFGKASHFCYFSHPSEENNFKYSTSSYALYGRFVRNKKYLVINKNSNIDKDLLFQVALQLTSSDFQTLSTNKFCKVPTYNIDVVKTDSIIEDAQYREILQSDHINIKKIFESKFGAPYMEVRAFLPGALKKYLEDGDSEPLVNMLENIYYLVMDKASNKDVSLIVLYIPMVISSAIAVVIIYFIIKFRNHPRIKILSPTLCILIIIGYFVDIPLTPYFLVEEPSLSKCKIEFIESISDMSIIMFPMLAITYRLYSIYNNTNLFISKTLKDNNLLAILGVFFVFCFVITVITAYYIFHFFIVSFGNISTYRQQSCSFDENVPFQYLNYSLFFLLFAIILYMIIKTGKASKRFGEFNYIYGLILILIAESIREFVIPHIPAKGYFTYLMIFIMCYMVYNLLCIYIIIGARLRSAIKNTNSNQHLPITTETGDSYNVQSTTNMVSKRNLSLLYTTYAKSQINSTSATINTNNNFTKNSNIYKHNKLYSFFKNNQINSSSATVNIDNNVSSSNNEDLSLTLNNTENTNSKSINK